jgi:phage baseplate assembly protein W
MRLTRADTLTSAKRQFEYYSDFFVNFVRTPTGGELAMVHNENSVSQSIKNLVLTNFGDRLFAPSVCGIVSRSLFELSGTVFTNFLIDSITSTINTYEPRARLDGVYVSDIDDAYSVTVTIVYYLLNSYEPVTLTVFLKRVR